MYEGILENDGMEYQFLYFWKIWE